MEAHPARQGGCGLQRQMDAGPGLELSRRQRGDFHRPAEAALQFLLPPASPVRAETDAPPCAQSRSLAVYFGKRFQGDSDQTDEASTLNFPSSASTI
jgi:hypothetical protein